MPATNADRQSDRACTPHQTKPPAAYVAGATCRPVLADRGLGERGGRWQRENDR